MPVEVWVWVYVGVLVEGVGEREAGSCGMAPPAYAIDRKHVAVKTVAYEGVVMGVRGYTRGSRGRKGSGEVWHGRSSTCNRQETRSGANGCLW